MGGRRLPGEKVTFAVLALGWLVLGASCGSDAGGASVEPSESAAATATATTVAPSPTATQDPLGAAPADVQAAQAGLTAELVGAPTEPCPQRLQSLWKVRCVHADLDGDGESEDAYLVPLQAGASSSFPAAVFVKRSGPRATLERLRFEGDADASRIGQEFFGAADRTGGGGEMQLSVLSVTCTANGCSYSAHVEAWDGSAWRDIGPTEPVSNLDHLEFRVEKNQRQLVMHGGMLNTAGAGPTRATTIVTTFDGHRYVRTSEKPDPPVYLFHAIRDADAKFDAGDFAGAIEGYQAAIGNTELKDWQKEARNTDGRSGLESYALFRVAVATAAMGADPTLALDAAIREAKDPLFAFAAERFRNGFLDRDSVTAGCAAATSYLSIVTDTSDNPAHLREVFDYGYANLPVKRPKDVCPL